MSYLIFNTIHSDDMYVRVNAYPPLHRPKERLGRVTIPGRHGQLTVREDFSEPMYEPVEKEAECTLLSGADLHDVTAWLSGAGYVTFGNEPLYQYEAVIEDEIAFEAIVPGRTPRRFTVKFLCQPYKTLVTPAADITISTNPQTISNPSNLTSLPTITIEGEDEVTVDVGDYEFTIDLTAATPVVIDCDAMMATSEDGLTSYLDTMTGDFPRLVPGDTAVSTTGTVTSLVITPNWRYL